MMIGGVDVKMTKSLRQRSARKQKELERNSKFLELKSCNDRKCSSTREDFESEMSTIEESVLLNRIVNVKSQTYSVKNSHMRSNLSNLARECDRHGVSDRAAAALASAVLADVGIVHNNDSSMVIDRSKVRRERVKGRRQLQCSSVKQVRGLYFDGRKDKTRVQVKTGKKSYPRVRTEEHITLV